MDNTNTELAAGGRHSTAAQPELLETKTIGIAGMTCDKCVKKIEKAFARHAGVKEIQINVENATATITFDTRQTNMAELHETLLRSGYKPVANVLVGA
jgi:copper chaperone CopZ